MIEILVSLVILSLGLLGVVALQAASLRNNQGAYERSVAVMMSYSMLDSMRANVVVARNGGYNYAVTDDCNPPAGATQADLDIIDWLAALRAELGGTACGNINCLNGLCVVQIHWDDSRGTDGDEEFFIETEARL